MTATESLISSINLLQKLTTENYVDTKGFSDNANQFSAVLESANKSYNFTYEKVSETPLSYAQQNNTFQNKEDYLSDIKNNNNDNIIKNEAKEIRENEETIEYKEQNNLSENAVDKDISLTEKVEKKENISTEKEPDKKERNEDSVENKENNDTDNVAEISSKKSETQDAKAVIDSNINLILATTVPIQAVQQDKKPSTTDKNKSNTEEQQKSTENYKSNSILHIVEPKTLHTDDNVKQKQTALKQQQEIQNSNAETKDTAKTILNTFDSKQKNEDNASNQDQNTKSGSTDVKIDPEALKNVKADTTKKSDGTSKLKSDMIDDLKPKVTKIQLNESENNNKDLEVNSEKPSSNSLNFNSIESQVTRLNLTHQSSATNFEQVINEKTQQQTSSNSVNVCDQVTKSTIEQLQQNKSQISMVLNPESLGKVNIDFISEKGILTAQLTAETKEAKDILSKDIDNLKQNLQEQGINVNNISVKIQEPQQTDNGQLNSNQDSWKNTNEDGSYFGSNSSKNNNQEGKASYLTDSELNEMTASQKESLEESVDNNLIDYTV